MSRTVITARQVSRNNKQVTTMEKTKDSVLRQLEQEYEQACNAWVLELARMWNLDVQVGYWIGGETGGVYDFGGEWAIGMRDIRYAVRGGITYDQAIDWVDYVCWAGANDVHQPTLQEYVEYKVPILDEEARQRITEGRKRIEQMKVELMRICDEEVEKARKNFVECHNMTKVSE